jgi:hypothetical protein
MSVKPLDFWHGFVWGVIACVLFAFLLALASARVA